MSTLPSGRPAVLPWNDAADLLERQTEVLELIAGAAPLTDVLTRILTALEDLMPGARCSVLLLDRERGTLHHGAAPTLPSTYVRAIDGLAIGDGAGSCGTAASLNVAVVATDVRTDPRWVDYREAALAAGMRSCWSTPIEGRDGLPVGTFAVYHPEPHRPTAREELLVERFTHLASVAIGHAGLLADLVASEERFRRSYDDNALGMAILGPDRVVATANRALTGLAGRDLAGLPLADVLLPRDHALPELLDGLDRAGGGPLTVEGQLRRGRATAPRRGEVDEHVDVEVTLSLLRETGPGAAAGQYVVNVLDLTERRAAERDRRARLEAETARRTAEALSHAKSELLAAVGHEARTPIQAIVGFAELLGTMDLDETRRREALGHITTAAGHVIDLLADVLDLSRLEAGALPLQREPVGLDDAVADVVGLLSETAARRSVRLEAPDATRVRALADRRRLRQVLLNLVGNGVRHGAEGGRVAVASRLSADGAWVEVTVADDGPGIPGELLPRLFAPFSRAAFPTPGRADEVVHEESVGLGLGLAHSLARAMGGDLSIGGTGPAGTTMVLRLPAADGAEPR